MYKCLHVPGSDLFLEKRITVMQSPLVSEAAMTPVAHTCGCVLKIPENYSSAILLRGHFTNILKANYWSMDIV
jgi:hypothetical protein